MWRLIYIRRLLTFLFSKLLCSYLSNLFSFFTVLVYFLLEILYKQRLPNRSSLIPFYYYITYVLLNFTVYLLTYFFYLFIFYLFIYYYYYTLFILLFFLFISIFIYLFFLFLYQKLYSFYILLCIKPFILTLFLF